MDAHVVVCCGEGGGSGLDAGIPLYHMGEEFDWVGGTEYACMYVQYNVDTDRIGYMI